MEQLIFRKQTTTHTEVSLAVRCSFGFLMLLSEILLFGSLGLVIYWILYYQGGIAWVNNTHGQYNLHYILMIGGFIFLNGQSMLAYRSFQCCKKIYVKVLHTIFFVLAISAITIGLVVAIQAADNTPNAHHFYSLHSWIGLTAIGFFGLQFVVGFISFLVLLCCDTATAKFRQRLLPTHVSFGLIIFGLASAATLTGLMQSARHRFSGLDGKPNYQDMGEQPLVVNVLAMTVVGLLILLPFIILNKSFKRYTTLTIN